MNRLRILLLAGLCILVAGTGEAFAVSEQQRAYDACLKTHNGKRKSFAKQWAIVAGIGSSGTTCFWVTGHDTVSAARQAALANCKERYSRCFTWSWTGGSADWVDKISDNGGSDGSRSASSNGSDDEAAAAIVQGLIGGIGAMSRGGGGGGGGHTYRPSSPCVSTTGATCGQR